MKIAVLNTEWKESQGSGVSRYVINLVRELEKNSKFDVVVLFRKGSDGNNYLIKGNKFSYPFKALKKLKGIKPDVIYTDANWYYLITSILYNRLNGCKIIATIHSHPHPLFPLIENSLLKILVNKIDCIVFTSKHLQQIYHTNWHGRLDVNEQVIYAGVQRQSVEENDVNNFYKTHSIKTNSFILLMQSSPSSKIKTEGTKILMDAIKIVSIEIPRTTLIITGTGPYLNELKQYAKKNQIDGLVIFTGWIDNPFIPISICDVYTHITLGEGGVSLAVLEAMSMGKPIVATSVGGIPEAITHQDSGILVPLDANQIAATIISLSKDGSLKKKLGEHAKNVAEINFRWEYTAESVIKTFFN